MRTYRPYIVLSIVLIVLMLMFVTSSNQRLTVDHPNELNSGWIFESETIDLPVKLDVPKNTSYQIHQMLDERFHEPQIIMIRTSLQDVIVELDGIVLYEKSYGESLDKPYASMWHLILLPRHVDGQNLVIEFSSPYQDMSGVVNEIYFGTQSMHYNFLFETYGLRLVIGFIVFIIGVIVMISNLIITKNNDKGFAYAGLFVVLLSLWMIAESRMLQFFTGSTLLIGSLAYLVLPLFPIPLVNYLTDHVFMKYKKPLYFMKYVFLFQFVLVIALYVFRILDFFETVAYTQILIFMGIILVIMISYIEIKYEKNEKAHTFMKIFIFLALFAVLELVNFLLNDFRNTSLFLSIGFGIIMIGLLIVYTRYLFQRMKLSYEKEFYEKLAFMDHVTQGFNRLAFERDIDTLFKDPHKKENLRLIVFDLDDLKGINDAYGHVEGDKAIKKTFDIISEAFGSCYRIGGDEFACIYENTDEASYMNLRAMINDLIDTYEHETPYHFGLSFGSAVVKNSNMTPNELMHLADLDMYKDKKHSKTINNESS
ncbi:MAG: GGDEF domain-containing protein [Acholeplasmataceae bacterium]|nr:GGDEF domain-containing protein [Acholeplasmataceae bacterium]